MASLASINIRFAVDLKEFSTEMQNSLRTIDKVGQKFQAVGRNMSAYVTLPILAAGAAAVKFASDYNESLNKVDVSFKASSTEVKTFAKTTLETAGIAEGTALDMASAYGDMGTSMGLTTGQAAKMSTSLVGLAGDLASFKNISIDIANTAISAIFTGETESLKKLGIVMTEVNLKQFALNSGIQKNYEQMSQAEKVQLRYNYILSVTKNAQGDFIRTQGGAANQSRIFTESLKQVGQQLGSVVLPLVTSVLTKVNEWIKEFSKLSEGTKTTIVVIAGLVAAIGPLLLVIGGVMSAIPIIVVGFTAVSAAILPILAGITLLYGAFLILKPVVSETAKATDDLNKAISAGNKAAVSEVASLDTLYAAATNVKLSTEKRKEAIDQLQALYPAYFKNIDDETIKNGKAEVSYNQLRNAIFNKARAAAVENQLQQNANKRIEKEIELQEKINEARGRYLDIQKNGKDTTATVAVGSTGGVTQTFVSQKDKIKEAGIVLGAYKTDLQKFYADSLKADEILLNAKSIYDTKSEKLTANEIARKKAEADASAAAANSQSGAITDKIKKVESKGVNIPKPQLSNELDFELPTLPTLNITYYEDQIARYRKLQDEFSTNNEEGHAKYQAYAEAIANTELIIQDIQGVDIQTGQIDGLVSQMEGTVAATQSSTDLIIAQMERIQEIGGLIAQSVGESFSALGYSIVDSLGLASTGLGGFASTMLKTLVELMAMVVKQIVVNQALAISNSIAGATASGAATGPAAIFTTPAFIATAISGVLAAFMAIPKFATGGIVSGGSMYGDKILARVNSGEMIANSDQQKKIWGAMNAGSNVNVTVGGDFEIEGTKLRLVLNRTDKRDNRTR